MQSKPGKRLPSASQSQAAAKLIKYLADPQRLGVLLLLCDDEWNVGDLASIVRTSSSALSRHLTCLRLAELVETRREGQRVFYSLTASGRELVRTVQEIGVGKPVEKARARGQVDASDQGRALRS